MNELRYTATLESLLRLFVRLTEAGVDTRDIRIVTDFVIAARGEIWELRGEIAEGNYSPEETK